MDSNLALSFLLVESGWCWILELFHFIVFDFVQGIFFFQSILTLTVFKGKAYFLRLRRRRE